MDIRKLGSHAKLLPGVLTKVLFQLILQAILWIWKSSEKLADEYSLWIIEDTCHAPGGYFMDSKGKKQHCGNGRLLTVPYSLSIQRASLRVREAW